MSPKFVERLVTAHPVMFEHCEDVACGDGWFELLETMCSLMADRSTRNNAAWPIRLGGIKSKFGRLCLSIECDDPFIDGLVDAAMELALMMCAACGHPGRQYPRGCLSVLCRGHFEEENKLAWQRREFDPGHPLPDYDTAARREVAIFMEFENETEIEHRERRARFDLMLKRMGKRKDEP